MIRAISRLERSGIVTPDAGGFTLHDLEPLRCTAQLPESAQSGLSRRADFSHNLDNRRRCDV